MTKREELTAKIAALEQLGSYLDWSYSDRETRGLRPDFPVPDDPMEDRYADDVLIRNFREELAALPPDQPEPLTDGYKLFVWTDHCTFAAVAHAKSVSQARELIEAEDLGGIDGSCEYRAAARKMIYGETPGIYRGAQAVLMFDTGKADQQEPWTARERRLREAIEKAADRLSIDPEDVEYVDSCPHCGDDAIDNIDSEEWPFDDHGDMLCRLCGGHRGLCGYSSGGGNEVVAILRHALSDTPPPDPRDEALKKIQERLATIADELDNYADVEDRPDNGGVRPNLAMRVQAEVEDVIAAIRAARGGGA